MLVLPVVGAVIGAVLGGVQWWLLPEGHARAPRWIVASAIGVGVGLAAGWVAATAIVGPGFGPVAFAALAVASGAGLGAATGSILGRAA